MKCPYCDNELGLNNICINVTCSHFGATINSSENDTFDNSSNNYQNVNNCNGTKNIINEQYQINDNISDEEFSAFFSGNNTNYYLKYLQRFRANNKFLSWNWSCFFLSNYWLLYRKLYTPAVAFIIFNFVSTKLFRFKVHIFLLIIVHFFLGMFANSIYLNNSKHKIKNIKKTIFTSTKSEYMNELHSRGGVTLLAPLILLIIYILIIIVYTIALLNTIIHQPELHSPSHYF